MPSINKLSQSISLCSNNSFQSIFHQDWRLYSKLSVRERRLLEKQMEKQEKGILVKNFINKYFSTTEQTLDSKSISTMKDQTKSTISIDSSNKNSSQLPVELSLENYKKQRQIEKILELELTRKRNSANPKSMSSPGRVNAMILQQDIDKSIYNEYTRKCFQHGFDIFIAKLRKESQANHKTKQLFSINQQQQATSQGIEERLSYLVSDEINQNINLQDSHFEELNISYQDDNFTKEVSKTNTNIYKKQNNIQLKNGFTPQMKEFLEPLTEEDAFFASPESLNHIFVKLKNQNQPSSLSNHHDLDDTLETNQLIDKLSPTNNISNDRINTFKNKFLNHEEETIHFSKYMPRDNWFEDEIDDDFETLDYAYEDSFEQRMTMQL